MKSSSTRYEFRIRESKRTRKTQHTRLVDDKDMPRAGIALSADYTRRKFMTVLPVRPAPSFSCGTNSPLLYRVSFRLHQRRRPVQRIHPGSRSRPRAKTHKICHITLASVLTTKRKVLVSWSSFLPNILCLPASSLLCFGVHYCALFQSGAFFATYFRACGSIP